MSSPFRALNRRDMPDNERYMWVAGTMVACAALFAATWLLSTVIPAV
eukprot:CAMPEP_0174828322 /NCGR_PEP_ID=MMETSP1114-20130205/1261_1 /TAXON_ID=312471 /ORGANISM="Neobodo designis, Strain CCAP 1951/1" /LENGTH=46 /DNA_ID= /DNA_START= /DNA_END= /DNA_ORIENTATION=